MLVSGAAVGGRMAAPRRALGRRGRRQGWAGVAGVARGAAIRPGRASPWQERWGGLCDTCGTPGGSQHTPRGRLTSTLCRAMATAGLWHAVWSQHNPRDGRLGGAPPPEGQVGARKPASLPPPPPLPPSSPPPQPATAPTLPCPVASLSLEAYADAVGVLAPGGTGVRRLSLLEAGLFTTSSLRGVLAVHGCSGHKYSKQARRFVGWESRGREGSGVVSAWAGVCDALVPTHGLAWDWHPKASSNSSV